MGITDDDMEMEQIQIIKPGRLKERPNTKHHSGISSPSFGFFEAFLFNRYSKYKRCNQLYIQELRNFKVNLHSLRQGINLYIRYVRCEVVLSLPRIKESRGYQFLNICFSKCYNSTKIFCSHWGVFSNLDAYAFYNRKVEDAKIYNLKDFRTNGCICYDLDIHKQIYLV